MKFKMIISLAVVSAVLSGVVYAQQKADKKAPAVKPAEDLNKVRAQVGDKKITVGDLQTAVKDFIEANKARFPQGINAEQKKQLTDSILGQKIQEQLMRHYIKKMKIVPSKEQIAKAKAEIEGTAKRFNMTIEQFMKAAGMEKDTFFQLAALQKMMAEASDDKAIDLVIKSNPEYFNGTKVSAAHLLLMCSPVASTAEQKKAIAKLNKIKADVAAGKIKWDDAVVKYSQGPSAPQKGDLGEFEFFRMVPPFAIAAFGAKVGDVVGPVRSEFGFHLIKVKGRTEGKLKVDPKDPQIRQMAKMLLTANVMGKIFGQALEDCPIIINK